MGKASWHRLFVGIGMTAALTGLAALTASPASAATREHIPGLVHSTQYCQGPSSPGEESFEQPIAPTRGFSTLRAGTAIGPWTVTQNNVDLIGKDFWQAADGNQSVDLSGSAYPIEGAVARTFDTNTLPLPLYTYVVTFCLAGNPQGGPSVKTGQVLLNGTPVRDFSFDTAGRSVSAMGYRAEKVTFGAVGPTATVEFRSTTPTAYGPVIDKVRFTRCLLGVLCF